MTGSRLAPLLSRAVAVVLLAAVGGLLLAATQIVFFTPVAARPQGVPSWTELASDRPLASHHAIGDTVGRRMILHGGERDAVGNPPLAIRQFDLSVPNGRWSDLGASGTPPRPRLDRRGLQGSKAVVDPEENIALVVCDCRNGSAHVLDLSAGRWSRAPSDRPLTVWNYLFVYDPVNDRALLFGGDQRGDNKYTNAGWQYDLSPERRGWRSLPPVAYRTLYQAAGYDPVSGHLVVFSGLDARLDESRELWRLDVANADGPDAWREITDLAGPGPAPRGGATLTFVPGTTSAILYGGYSNGGDLHDSWLLDYSDPEAPRWSTLEVPGPGPGARAGHSALWDTGNERLVIYGGVRGISFLDDAWALDPGLGAEPTPTATPTAPVATRTPTLEPTATLTREPYPTPTDVWRRIYLPLTEAGWPTG